ncbi:MAG: class I SAM-dependent methyltransferase [Candidatus Dojkabacteria bacterium]|nr:class I SAM-dependent methyltransferase [Candidatus Dojkabacteria bacterium]
MEQYTQKYTESGKIGGFLIDNYFKNVKELIALTDINSKAEGNVLEVGCGPGYSTEKLLDMLPEDINLKASDIEEENLDDARKLLGERVSLSKEDIYDLKVENSSIDLIFILEVLEHLEEPQKALEEIKRVTKQYAIVAVPREPIWRMLNMVRFKYLKDFGNTPGHIQHWSSISFKKLLKNNGFRIVSAKYPLPWTMLLVKKVD